MFLLRRCVFVLLFGVLVSTGVAEDDLGTVREIIEDLNSDVASRNLSTYEFPGTFKKRIFFTDVELKYVRFNDLASLELRGDDQGVKRYVDIYNNSVVQFDLKMGLKKLMGKALYMLRRRGKESHGTTTVVSHDAVLKVSGVVVQAKDGTCRAEISRSSTANVGSVTVEFSMTDQGSFVPVFLGPPITRLANRFLPHLMGRINAYLNGHLVGSQRFSEIVCNHLKH